MRKSLTIQRCVTVLAVFMLLASVQSAYADGGSSYWVDGEPLQWELEGLPDSSRPVDYVEFQIGRNDAEDTMPLVFSLSKLDDGQGNVFPRQLLVVTLDDGEKQTWDSEDSKVEFLGSDYTSAEIKIGLDYREKVPAGTYRGYLHSDTGPDIPITIIVKQYTVIAVNPSEVHMDAPNPGIWTTEEEVEVTVQANHGNWAVTLSSDGLFPEADKDASFLWSFEEPQVSPLELIALVDSEERSLREGYQFSGSDYGWDGSFSFRLQIETGWEHKAGPYAGVIHVQVDEEQVNREGIFRP